MPRIDVPVTAPTRSGVALPAPTVGDPANNHSTNSGTTYLLVENTGSTVSRTVTFLVARTVDGLAVTSRAEAIAVGATQIFGPFSVNDYGSTLNVDVDHAELTLRAIRV